MLPIPLYIQAGGQSKRFGQNKARQLLHGQPLIVSVANTLSPHVQDTFAIGKEDREYDDLGLTTVPDILPNQGPLGGLLTALTHRSTQPQHNGWCAVVSCDMAGLQGQWLDLLWHARTPDSSIVAFHSERWDPLFALYHVGLLPDITQRLHDNQRAMWRFLEQNNATAVPHPDGWEHVVSINTPDDLQRVLTTHQAAGER